MININIEPAVLDNVVEINGIEIARLSDTDAQKVLDIVQAMSRKANSTVKTPKKSSKFPTIEAECERIGAFVTVYPTLKLVRYWEGSFTPEKVKFGIKKSLTEAGAKWNSEQGAYEFSTKKAFDAWVKEQKNR